jgi:polysaccharide chain length determinant protein (PEP-CTERM system associated)
MEETHVHALDYLNVFRRRKWWFIVPVLGSIGAGALLLKVLPKEFKSTALIGVMAPSVSPTIVSQLGLDNMERQRALQQQLVNSSILARVAREEGLGSGRTDDRVVSQLRSRIAVTVPDPITNTGEIRRLDTFQVSYSDATPDRAQQIANRLVTVFVDENSKVRASHAEDTSMFLQAQLETSQQRLDDLEANLRRAKEAHMGQLPEQQQANLATLQGLRQQLESTATSLRGEQDRLSVIERQLQGVASGSTDVLFVPRTDASIQTPESRVMTLQRQLAEARTMYRDKHPEVQRLQDELKSAQAEVAADQQKPTEDRVAQLRLDPAYRQLSNDRQTSQLRVRDLQRTQDDLTRQIRAYQARVESAPMVEQQLMSVQRDYDLEKQHYNDLTSKYNAATIAENVERNGRGEQFTVLERASRPGEPVKPIPWRVMLISIVAGFCLGGAASFGREYLDRSVHDMRDLKDEFELPVLGEVARIGVA